MIILANNNRIPVVLLGAVLLMVILLFSLLGHADQCDGIESRFGEVKKAWHDGELFVLLRHTEKCSYVVNGCPPGDTGLTEEGIRQAELVGRGLRRLGHTGVDVFYSPAVRTAMTAEIAMSVNKKPLDWLVEGCRHELLKKIK